MTTPTPTTAARPGLWARLRNPKPADLVEVTFTGSPQAVTAVARALATVTVVTSIRHHVQPDPPGDVPVIRLDATCHLVARIREGGRR